MLKINEIFILSEVQHLAYLDMLSHNRTICWLQNDTSECVYKPFVKTAAGNSIGCAHPDLTIGVRPALIINGVMPVKSTIEFAGFRWVVCSCISHTTLMICDDIIAYRRFDAENNDWNTSELKAWLEGWLEYVCEGLDDVILEKERE